MPLWLLCLGLLDRQARASVGEAEQQAVALEALEMEFGQQARILTLEQRDAQLRAACAQGWTPACDPTLWRGPSGPDLLRAAATLAPRCEAGDGLACVVVAWAAGQSQDPGRPSREAAMAGLERSCAAEQPAACAHLGQVLRGAYGWPRDDVRAEEILRRACDEGLAAGCATLGYHLVDLNRTEAQTFLDQACARGETGACLESLRLTHVHEPSRIAQRRLHEAAGAACDEGQGVACYILADLLQGESHADPQEVTRLFQRACDAGVSWGCQEAGLRVWAGAGADASGDRAQALALLERAAVEHRRFWGEDDTHYASILLQIGRLRLDRELIEPAVSALKQAHAIYAETLGLTHPDCVSAMFHLSRAHLSSGLYDTVIRDLTPLITQLEPAGDSLALASLLDRLGTALQGSGRHDEARARQEQALHMHERLFGADSTQVASSLNNLGLILSAMGRDDLALSYHQRALSIAKARLAPDDPELAYHMQNLGLVYHALGDPAQALPLLEGAVQIRTRVSGANSLQTGIALGNVGLVYAQLGEHRRAVSTFRRAVNIQQAVQGPNHPHLSAPLTNLASAQWKVGEIELAKANLERALAIAESTYGPMHLSMIFMLDGLAAVAWQEGDRTAAVQHIARAYHIALAILGPEHPNTNRALAGLANMTFEFGEDEHAMDLTEQVVTMDETFLRRNLPVLSAEARGGVLKRVAMTPEVLVRRHVERLPTDPTAARLALTAVLQHKGRLLDLEADTLSRAREGLNAEGLATYQQWLSALSRLDHLNGLASGDDAWRRDMQHTADEISALEMELGRRSEALRQELLPATPATIAGVLPADAALVELVSYLPLDAATQTRGAAHLVAYVLHADGVIGHVDLGPVAVLEQASADLRRAILARADVTTPARLLGDRLWAPLVPALRGATRVMIAPTGQLSLLPFDAVQSADGRPLSEQVTLSMLTSGRDLLRVSSSMQPNSPPLIIAAPDYDRASDTEERSSRAWQGSRWRALAGARAEGQVVADRLPGANLVTGRDATEALLKATPSPDILHVATHGFYLDAATTASRETRGVEVLPESERASATLENPMLRAGIVLAGANQREQSSHGENGILTALEASGLSLGGTRLVVLSACQTGVGSVTSGDGVQGMRRALLLAGSRSQILSLWAVDDASTAQLMEHLYDALAAGQGTAQALRTAREALRADPRWAHPYYWAAFTASGDPGATRAPTAPPTAPASLPAPAPR